MAGKRAAVNHLDRHLANYLRLRRALGFRLAFPGHVLPGLVAYLGAAGASTVTTEHAVAWARLPAGVQPIAWAHRLGAARGFARYLHTIDPATEVPPRDVFAARQQRPVPHIWSYAEVRALDPASTLKISTEFLTDIDEACAESSPHAFETFPTALRA